MLAQLYGSAQRLANAGAMALTWQPHQAQDGAAPVVLATNCRLEARMSYYLMQVAHTAEGWQALVENPHHRVEALRPAIEDLGGRIENAWYSFGEFDITLIVQMPDNVSAAALSIALASGEALKNVKTTPLLTATEAMEAMKRAGKAGARAVSAD